MNSFVFSNSYSRCDNSNCKFVKDHSYICSDRLGYEVVRCENGSCCKIKNHSDKCLFYNQDDTRQQSIQQYTQPNMFNMQYQSLINDYTRYKNFNNNNDQRKFIINYNIITNNNYYANPQIPDSPPVQQSPKIEEVVKNSNFMPEFVNPSTMLNIYRK